MKGKRPTMYQKKIMEKEGLNPRDWLVLKNPTNSLTIQSKDKSSIKTIEISQ